MAMQMYPANSLPTSQTPAIVNDLPKATGSQEARGYLTRPSTRDVIWDKDENFFYMRITDATGKIISFERYSYDPSPEPKMEDLFVSNDKFNEVTAELQGGINDVKESIQQLTAALQSNAQHKRSNKSDRGDAKGSSAVG